MKIRVLKMLGNYGVAAQLVASRLVLSSIQLVISATIVPSAVSSGQLFHQYLKEMCKQYIRSVIQGLCFCEI
jgi:hypothetical protein